MRPWCLVLLLALLPLANAQPLPESIEGTDPGGDVELFAPDGSSLGTTDQMPHLDVLGGRVSKAASGDMAFEILLADPSYASRADQEGDLSTSIALYFDFGGIRYYVDYGDWRRDGMEACLTRYIDGERIDPVQCFPTFLEEGWIRTEIPGSYITDRLGAVLRHPAQLAEIYAEGRSDSFIHALDRAPDAGIWGELLTPADPDAGPLIITPVNPLRGSNGGPTVVVFHLLVDNIADEPLRPLVRIGELPRNWEAVAPAQVVVAPGVTSDVPVIVKVPGAHAHGTTHKFDVTLELLDGKTWAIDLGIHFFTIPQPAGHHDTLYLHGQDKGDFQRAWMDTLTEAEGEDGTPARPWWTVRNPFEGTATSLFHIGMAPDLRIGLDFRAGDAVLADMVLAQDQIAGDAQARISLEHCNPVDTSGRSYAEYLGDMRCPGSWFSLAQATDEVTIEPQGTTLDWRLPVTPYADLVPPQEGALMALMMEVTRPLVTSSDGLRLSTTGSSLQLPLDEYQDPLDADLSALAGLRIKGEKALAVGPGSQVWIPWTVHNEGRARTLEFQVFGHNAEWAQVRPPVVRVDTGKTATIHIGVEVPERDFADLFVVGTDVDDPAVTVAHGLRVMVDESLPPRKDAAPDAAEGQRAPLPAVALLVLGLALLARRTR